MLNLINILAFRTEDVSFCIRLLRVTAVLGLLTLVVVLGGLKTSKGQEAVSLQPLVIETTGDRYLFNVEGATTQAQRAVGLMWRESLAANHGMLFIYQKKQQITMWMHNTALSLDMIFISSDGTIDSIVSNTIPFSKKLIKSNALVNAVLELPAGTVMNLGIATGDLVRHSLFSNYK